MVDIRKIVDSNVHVYASTLSLIKQIFFCFLLWLAEVPKTAPPVLRGAEWWYTDRVPGYQGYIYTVPGVFLISGGNFMRVGRSEKSVGGKFPTHAAAARRAARPVKKRGGSLVIFQAYFEIMGHRIVGIHKKN